MCQRWALEGKAASCYSSGVASVAVGELKRSADALLERVADGERITLTLRGCPVAELAPPPLRETWIDRDRFLAEVLPHQADPTMADDLAELSDETTDDLPWP